MNIRGIAPVSLGDVARWATSLLPLRPNDLTDYLNELHRLCTTHGLRFDVLAAQSAHETNGWKSDWWNRRLNPAGIGITGDPKQDAVSREFESGAHAARAHFLHMWLYVVGATLPTGLVAMDDPRWDAALRAGYDGMATTLDDLSGTWAADRKYADGILKWLGIMRDAGMDIPEGTDMAPKTRNKPIVIAVGMGHRNTGRGGAKDEINWTPEAARAFQRRGRARGMIVELIAEHDRDNDPNWSNTDRQSAAAIGVANIVKKQGGVDVIVFHHYNGGNAAGAHFLFPDGWVSPVRTSENPGDVRLAKGMARHTKATGTVSLLSWPDAGPGVMSERESGAVNNTKGWRLGEFLGTDEWREAFRIIAEAGSIDVARERAYIRDPRWVEFTYCEALLDAIEDELGVYQPGDGTGGPKPPIDPTPQPDPQFATPIRIPEIDVFRTRPAEASPSAIFTKDYGWMWQIDREVRTTKVTARQAQPDPDNKERTGVDLPEGEVFYAWYGGVSPVNGKAFIYTLWASYVNLEDTDQGLPA